MAIHDLGQEAAAGKRDEREAGANLRVLRIVCVDVCGYV